MYIRRKVFSVLDTEVGDRLFSLDQREFTGETKKRNKSLKRQWLEKQGEKPDGRVRVGRFENERRQRYDELAWKELLKRRKPEEFKESREIEKEWAKTFKNLKKITADLNEREAKSKVEAVIPQSPKPTTPNPEVVVVPEKALVVSNSKPVVKTESKLSKLAKNKYAKGGAGLLVLGGTAAGGYYLLNKKKNKKDKEDKD